MKEKAELSDFKFEFQSGHMEFHPRLRIIFSYDKIIQWKIPKKTPLDLEIEKKVATIREMDFTKNQMVEFVERISKLKIWDLENCTDRALPDTPMLFFRITNKEQLVLEAEAWENCRNDSKRVKELIKTLGSYLPHNWSPP